MKYVYDITINLKNNYLDFFEWNKTDKISHIRKLPIIKISNHDLITIINSSIIISKDLLTKIKIGKKYLCLFISDNNGIVLEFDQDGKSINISSIIVDEELDILENYYKLPQIKIEYQVLSSSSGILITRLEQERIAFLENAISKLSLPQDQYKIKYLYFECFGKIETNPSIALKKIKESFQKNNYLANLYQFFKLIETK